jgi:hypothetical protein
VREEFVHLPECVAHCLDLVLGVASVGNIGHLSKIMIMAAGIVRVKNHGHPSKQCPSTKCVCASAVPTFVVSGDCKTWQPW